MSNWWNKNAESRIEDFKSWVGDSKQPSKMYCRAYIANKQYQSVIDCGCGLALDNYNEFKTLSPNIVFTGLDSCSYFVTVNQSNGIPMVEAELEKDLPIPDNSYESVYCREVLEHLSHYEKTLSEFIRIGKQEILVIFFIKPDSQEEKINYWESEDLYHNKYNKEKLESFILSNPKVENLFWMDITDVPYDVKSVDPGAAPPNPEELPKPNPEKTILHILLKS